MLTNYEKDINTNKNHLSVYAGTDYYVSLIKKILQSNSENHSVQNVNIADFGKKSFQEKLSEKDKEALIVR